MIDDEDCDGDGDDEGDIYHFGTITTINSYRFH